MTVRAQKVICGLLVQDTSVMIRYDIPMISISAGGNLVEFRSDFIYMLSELYTHNTYSFFLFCLG